VQFVAQSGAQLGRLLRMTSSTRRVPAPPVTADSLTYLRVVETITDSGITQQQLAKAVGASVRTVQNWSQGSATPRGTRVHRLLDIKHIVELLRDTYTDEGIEIWLNSRNRNLDHQRPVDLLQQGRAEDVLAEVERLTGGMG